MVATVAENEIPLWHCQPRKTVAWERCTYVRPSLRRSSPDPFYTVLDGFLSNELKPNLISVLPKLRRFAQTLTRSSTEADDLVQEACLRALAKSHLWDSSQPLDRWMFRLMRNLWIGEIRKRQVRLGAGHVPAEEASELVDHQTGETAASAQDVQRMVSALPDDLSSVLLIVSVEGYSYAEASELLDIPIGTVMSRLHRARKTIAQKLAADGGCRQ